jgi:hypothetical protein
MIDTVLIVVIPWIAFGLSLAAICLRLCRFHRFTGRSRHRASRPPSDDDNGSSSNTSEPAGNADHRASASSSEAECPASRGLPVLQRGRR